MTADAGASPQVAPDGCSTSPLVRTALLPTNEGTQRLAEPHRLARKTAMPPFAAIPRTAVHAWCPGALAPAHPLLVTGTVSGALDDSFSTDSQLELWAPFADDVQGEGHTARTPLASVSLNARFNSLAWGTHTHHGRTPLGTVAAGLDDGGVSLWDPNQLLQQAQHRGSAAGGLGGSGGEDPLIARLESPHCGPVRGLDFSPAQSNLLATGATNGEVRSGRLTRAPREGPRDTRAKTKALTPLNRNSSPARPCRSTSGT